MRGRERFVFAVCGDAVYIDQLQRATRHLERFGDREVIVVTDTRRNEGQLDGPRVVDVRTPESLDHRQASIWLKTSLPQHLDPNFRYCYLDADVLAVRSGVEQVFLYDFEPVVFASDHCRIDYFSPCAVTCGCWNEEKEESARELDMLIQRFETIDPDLWPLRRQVESYLDQYESRYEHPPPEIGWRRDQLREFLDRYRGRQLPLIWGLLTKILRRIGPRLTWDLWKNRNPNRVIDDYLGPITERIRKELGVGWRESDRQWYDDRGRVVLRDVPWHVERAGPYRFDPSQNLWLDLTDEPVFHRRCEHLREAVSKKFAIGMTDGDWRHWNGGVFLFGPGADSFFDLWHRLTLEAFEDPYWMDRDQGTLAASAWALGLENLPRLPKEFNFLADYQRPDLQFSESEGFAIGGNSEWIQPFLVHVYHHWGDREWDVWRWLEGLMEKPS